MSRKSNHTIELTKPNKKKLRQKLINCTKHAEEQPTNTHAQATLARVQARATAHKVSIDSVPAEEAA